jgi:hypothetical protein
MHDTDRVVRQPSALQFIDLTPTTVPSWSPPPVARLARGTMLPPVARPVDLDAKTTKFERFEPEDEAEVAKPRARRATAKLSLEEAMALGVRELATPRRWGTLVRVGLDGQERSVAEPRRPRPRPAPAVPVVEAALLAAISIVVAIAIGVWARPDTRAPAPAPALAPPRAPAPVVTITPLEPEPAEIEMPALAAPVAKPIAKKPASLPVGMTGGEGVVAINAKPPCRILVDGKDTGLRTPIRELRLTAGEHEITLVNDEYGIEDRNTITVNAGAPARLVRDLTAKLPNP